MILAVYSIMFISDNGGGGRWTLGALRSEFVAQVSWSGLKNCSAIA